MVTEDVWTTEEVRVIIKDTCRPRGYLELAGAEFPTGIYSDAPREGKCFIVRWIQAELDPVSMLSPEWRPAWVMTDVVKLVF